ncbi:MAG: ABC transporter ATP-binding protein [Pseudomonadales bacterium]|nr:ABC transporter ATP-binding protein [Pseudomonadales bacterium]
MSRQASRDVVFRASQLSKTYDMGEVQVHALRGVDIELYEGEFIVILGASGSGKSTLLNILGGLDSASSGSVHDRDTDLSNANETALTRYRREQVGFVFQFYNLIASLNAQENVEIVTDIARDPMPAMQALELVGLGERAQHFPAQLSGGEQQRVAIARAIAKKPQVLLCDEPTGALDSKTGVVVLEALQRINEELGTSTAIITHNADIAAMADRVIEMSDGRISNIRQNQLRLPARQITW